MLGNNCCRRYFEIVLYFFPENRTCHFMQIVSSAEFANRVKEKNYTVKRHTTPPSRHMTFIQHCLNIDATSRRCIDVEATLYKRHVSAGDGLFTTADSKSFFNP